MGKMAIEEVPVAKVDAICPLPTVILENGEWYGTIPEWTNCLEFNDDSYEYYSGTCYSKRLFLTRGQAEEEQEKCLLLEAFEDRMDEANCSRFTVSQMRQIIEMFGIKDID